MRDIVHRIIAGHILILQEVGCVAFSFGENRNQNVGTCHFGAAARLHMDRGALDHALERGGGNSLGSFDVGDQGREVIVDELF